MKFLLELLNIPRRLSRHKLKMLLCYVVLGLLVTFLISGKTSIRLESIAVSSNEQYIAFFETGNGYKIHCFQSDGSMAFTYNIPVDISAGGHCTLWFEDDVLCALFYRTDQKVSFSMDGTIMGIVDYPTEKYPSEFASFSRIGNQYIFRGSEIDVVYDKGSVLGYLIFDSERHLEITTQSGEAIIIYAWTARDGVINEKDITQ